MAINPANPVGYGKAFQASLQARKGFRTTARHIIKRRYDVSALWLRGWTIQEIKDELGVSKDTVKRDLMVLRYQFLNGGLLNISVVMLRSMARMEALIAYGFDKLKALPSHQTGGKLMEEIRKCVEFEAHLTGAGEVNTKNLRVQSITANLSKEELDNVVNASLNEFDKLIQITDDGGDLLDAVQAAQPDV